ncbi:hypothetical protein [Arthrobacter sp. YC-RL1]|uniref:hypothetical protein n=1 Tax=Arthrobacter sp. YC-RL1 TaxID=1652545 RepID=UPI0012F7AC89|nr:hypothetical protein [Arthrobacter sp. YC-RL1]
MSERSPKHHSPTEISTKSTLLLILSFEHFLLRDPAQRKQLNGLAGILSTPPQAFYARALIYSFEVMKQSTPHRRVRA